MSSSLLFGSCFGMSAMVENSKNDYSSSGSADAADGWYVCPSTLKQHDDDDADDDDDVKQQQQQTNAINASSPPSPVGAHRRAAANLKPSGSKSNNKINLLAKVGEGARHLHRQEAALHQNRRLSLLQGSTLSKHTGSSPDKTEPSTDGDDDHDEEAEEEDGRSGGVRALVDLCVQECECDGDCVADSQLNMVEDDPYMIEAFGLQKNASGIVQLELLSAEQAQQQQRQQQGRGRSANTSAIHQLAHQQSRRLFWKNNPFNPALPGDQQLRDMNFVSMEKEEVDDDDDASYSPPRPEMVCIYRPRRSWPSDGEVRIRWALSRNTSPTTAAVLERWTAAVELCTTPTQTRSPASSCTTENQEYPTRLLNLSETNDMTTARLDGTVEIHDERTTSLQDDKEKESGAVADANHSDDANGTSNSREIACLTCYRIVFDEHEDNNNNNNNSTNNNKDDDAHDDTVAGVVSSPTLLPDPNGTIGYSEKKLATRRLFAQFDAARRGPLRQVMMERNEKAAVVPAVDEQQQQQQQQQQADKSRPACSPTTSLCIRPSSSPSNTAAARGDDTLFKQSSLLLPDQQHKHESASSSSSGQARSKKSHRHQQYFVIQDFTVHEDYRGIGLGLCLLDDACRRICDREAWVLVALPQQTSPSSSLESEASSSSNSHKSPAASQHPHRKRHFSLGRGPWNALTSSSLLSPSSRDKKPSTRDEAASLSSLPQTQQPQQLDPGETFLSYLGLLGFERLAADSPFCVRWNKGDHLPTIEEICPHVPIFHPSPPPPPSSLQSPQHVGEAQHTSSPSPS